MVRSVTIARKNLPETWRSNKHFFNKPEKIFILFQTIKYL